MAPNGAWFFALSTLIAFGARKYVQPVTSVIWT